MVFLGFQITSLLIIRVGAHRKVPNFFCFFIRNKSLSLSYSTREQLKLPRNGSILRTDAQLCKTPLWQTHSLILLKEAHTHQETNQELKSSKSGSHTKHWRFGPSELWESFSSYVCQISPTSSSWLACIMAGALERPQWLSEGSRKMKPDTRCYWDLFISELTCWLTAACHFERILMLDVSHTG